jgi:hypothetical protein
MPRMETALRLKELLLRCTPAMESYTRCVCPECTDVCCKQKHGLFTESDVQYLAALGEPVPSHDHHRASDGPCQFLGPKGCVKPRWQRAWKCTWYFCAPLLRALGDGSQRKARTLQAQLAEIGWLYSRLEGE